MGCFDRHDFTKTITEIRDRVEIVSIISDTMKLTRKGRSFRRALPVSPGKDSQLQRQSREGFFFIASVAKRRETSSIF